MGFFLTKTVRTRVSHPLDHLSTEKDEQVGGVALNRYSKKILTWCKMKAGKGGSHSCFCTVRSTETSNKGSGFHLHLTFTCIFNGSRDTSCINISWVSGTNMLYILKLRECNFSVEGYSTVTLSRSGMDSLRRYIHTKEVLGPCHSCSTFTACKWTSSRNTQNIVSNYLSFLLILYPSVCTDMVIRKGTKFLVNKKHVEKRLYCLFWGLYK